MTALRPKDVPAFLKKPSAEAHIVLFYGPDLGLVRDRAAQIAATVVDDVNDPFNAIELTDADLSEPGRLGDEMAALSFMGGRRLVRVRSGGAPVATAVKLTLLRLEDGTLSPNALTVIEAGDLKKTNALRKACEASKKAASIGCYPDGEQDVRATVRALLDQDGLTIEDDALTQLCSVLGDDRGITRSVAESLILYKGPAGTARPDNKVTTEDVRACVVDSAADATFDVIDAALLGQPSNLSRYLYRAQGAGVSPLGVLRILQGKMLRLLTVQSHIRNGDAPQGAMKKARPPVFFGEQRTFEQQLKKWPLKSLERAMGDVFETDLAAKTTGAPQRELVERTLLRLAAMAERAR